MADDDFVMNFAAPTLAAPTKGPGNGPSKPLPLPLPLPPSTKRPAPQPSQSGMPKPAIPMAATTAPKLSAPSPGALGQGRQPTKDGEAKKHERQDSAGPSRIAAAAHETTLPKDSKAQKKDAGGVDPPRSLTASKKERGTKTAAVVSLAATLSALDASRKALAATAGAAGMGMTADLTTTGAEATGAVTAIVRPATETAGLLSRTANDFRSLCLDPRLVQKITAPVSSGGSSAASSSAAPGSAAVETLSSLSSTTAFLAAATTVRRGHTAEGFGLSKPTRVQRLLISRYLEASAGHRLIEAVAEGVGEQKADGGRGEDEAAGAALLVTGAKDVMPPSAFVVRSETGSGKTLAFLLPAVHELLRAIEGGEFAASVADAVALNDTSNREKRQKSESAGSDSEDSSGDDENDEEDSRGARGEKSGDSAATTPRRKLLSREAGTLLLILAPTRELCAQIYGVASRLLQPFPFIIPSLLTGGEKKKSEKARLRKGVHVLVATPGRLADHLRTTTAFTTSNLRAIVMDEADRLLDMGFAAQVKEVFAELGKRLAAGETQVESLLSSSGYSSSSSSLGGRSGKRMMVEEVSSATAQGKSNPAGSNSGGSDDEVGEQSLSAVDASSVLAKLPVDRGVKLLLTSATITAQLRALIANLLPIHESSSPTRSFAFSSRPSVCFLDAIPTAPRPELILPGRALTSTSVNMQTIASPPGPLQLLEKEAEAAWVKYSATHQHPSSSSAGTNVTGGGEALGETAQAAMATSSSALSAPTLLSAPSQLQQVFMLAPIKWRLAALLGIVYDSIRTWSKANPSAAASNSVSSGNHSGVGIGGSGHPSGRSANGGLALSPALSRRGSKIILFVSTTHSADFHYVVFSHFLTWMLKRRAAVAAASHEDKSIQKASGAGSSGDAALAPGSLFPVFRLHGNIDQSERVRTYRSFAAAGSGLLVATDVAARGLDLPAVDLIVQADAPSDTADYVHRVGRTARRGQSGHAILLLQPHEAAYAEVLTSAGMVLQPASTAPVLAAMAKANGPAAAEAVMAMPRPIDHDFERRKAAEREAEAARAAHALGDAGVTGTAAEGQQGEAIGALWKSLAPQAGAMLGAPRAASFQARASSKQGGHPSNDGAAAASKQSRDAAALAALKINRLLQAAGFTAPAGGESGGRGGNKKGGKGGAGASSSSSSSTGDSGLGLADGVGAGSRTAEMQAALWQALLEEAVWRLPLPKELRGSALLADGDADASEEKKGDDAHADKRAGESWKKKDAVSKAAGGAKGGSAGGGIGKKKEDADVDGNTLRHLARLAFMSFVRGYATHERGVRHIFHPRALHLGHTAKAFGLTEAPTMVSNKTKRAAEAEKIREEKTAARAAREAADASSDSEAVGTRKDREKGKPGAAPSGSGRHHHAGSGYRDKRSPFDKLQKHGSFERSSSSNKAGAERRTLAGHKRPREHDREAPGDASSGAGSKKPRKITEYDA